MTETITTRSPEETAGVARRISRYLNIGDVLSLEGNLGAGKSVFARAVGAAKGVEGPMPSPTYAIALDYPGTIPVLHLDLYRLAGEDEFEMLDLEPLIATSLTIVEWGDRAPQLLNRARVRVRIEHGSGDDNRCLLIEWQEGIHGASARD